MLVTTPYRRATLSVLTALALAQHVCAGPSYATGYKFCTGLSYTGTCTFHSVSAPGAINCTSIVTSDGKNTLPASLQWFDGVECWFSKWTNCACTDEVTCVKIDNRSHLLPDLRTIAWPKENVPGLAGSFWCNRKE